MQFFRSFGALARHFVSVIAREQIVLPAAMEVCLRKVELTAKAKIGHPQAGWAPLSAATVARHGDTPLLDTGLLRSGITSHKTGHLSGVVAVEGERAEVAIFQELGTSRGIPPRPFLGPSLEENREFIMRLMGAAAFAPFQGGGVGLMDVSAGGLLRPGAGDE